MAATNTSQDSLIDRNRNNTHNLIRTLKTPTIITTKRHHITKIKLKRKKEEEEAWEMYFFLN